MFNTTLDLSGGKVEWNTFRHQCEKKVHII